MLTAAILRAAAAVRLKLREMFLADLPDRVLESGLVNPATLPAPCRKPFICYAILASLLEMLCAHLLGELPEGGDG